MEIDEIQVSSDEDEEPSNADEDEESSNADEDEESSNADEVFELTQTQEEFEESVSNYIIDTSGYPLRMPSEGLKNFLQFLAPGNLAKCATTNHHSQPNLFVQATLSLLARRWQRF